MGATVIEYNSNVDVLVRFDNGLESRMSWASVERLGTTFCKMKEAYIGLEKTMKDGSHCIISDYRGSRDLTVCFDDGTEVTSSYKSFCKGCIKKPKQIT